jgi:hypothetical protein
MNKRIVNSVCQFEFLFKKSLNKYDLEKFKNKENKNNLLKLLNRMPTH